MGGEVGKILGERKSWSEYIMKNVFNKNRSKKCTHMCISLYRISLLSTNSVSSAQYFMALSSSSYFNVVFILKKLSTK